jgi:tRNA U34 5-carboxymethylaminomethyl modifying GTPase MnmE/TrmE
VIGARLLTPRGRGAIAVISVRGEAARARVVELLALPSVPVGGLRLVRLRSGGEELDEALLVVRSECEVELHVHGSPPLVSELLELLGLPGKRQDEEPLGLEERAWRDLANAPCEAAARLLLDQAEGA